jgi:hypothetical protein
MSEVDDPTPRCIRRAAKHFFAEAKAFDELTMINFAVFAGVNRATVEHNFPRGQWPALKDKWLLKRLRRVMNEVHSDARVRKDFSVEKIIRGVGIGRSKFFRLLGAEWRTRSAALPTVKQKLTATIDSLVDADIPLANLTRNRVLKDAGVQPIYQDERWLSTLLRNARRKLSKKPSPQFTNPPPGVNARFIRDRWIDLDADVWDLRGEKGQILRRGRLREDLTEAAWELLREELRASDLTPRTLTAHCRNFIWAGDMLGREVSDWRTASLESVQRAWLSYKGTPERRRGARWALIRLFRTNIALAGDTKRSTSRSDIIKIAVWLRTMGKIPSTQDRKDFLSEDEVHKIINACLADIKAGIAFTESEVDLLGMSTWPNVIVNSAPVAQWAVALLVLVAVFTGLRRGSIKVLNVRDLMETSKGRFALAWCHGKTKKEKLAVIPLLIAQHLRLYIGRTEKLRKALGSESIFLTGNQRGDWSEFPCEASVNIRLQNFARRHHIEREGIPVALGCTMLRRSYTTRQLYDGQSIWALRLQLGHASVRSTQGYAKFDRYEHSAQVREALDEHGRLALGSWRNPVIPNAPPKTSGGGAL